MHHTDILTRVGGDEFAVLLPQTNATHAMSVADDFVKALDKEAAMLANESILITENVGVASFYYLKNLPFDYLKIDGAFICRISVHPVDHLVVKAIFGIAHGTGKQTVAKFVADSYTVRLLRDSGVD